MTPPSGTRVEAPHIIGWAIPITEIIKTTGPRGTKSLVRRWLLQRDKNSPRGTLSLIYGVAYHQRDVVGIHLIGAELLLRQVLVPALQLGVARAQGPYIPKNLPPYVPINGGGFTFITNQTISTPQKPIDYIDIYTTIDYQNFVYKAGTNLTIPLYFKLISHTNSTANVTFDPDSPDTLRCSQSLGPNGGMISLNDYMHYDYNGTLELKNDTLTKVTLTISIPSGLWPYPETTHIPFNLLGVDSVDNHVYIVPRFSGEIDL